MASGIEARSHPNFFWIIGDEERSSRIDNVRDQSRIAPTPMANCVSE